MKAAWETYSIAKTIEFRFAEFIDVAEEEVRSRHSGNLIFDATVTGA